MRGRLKYLHVGLRGKILISVVLIAVVFLGASTLILSSVYTRALNETKISRAAERSAIIGRGISSQIESASDLVLLISKIFPILVEDFACADFVKNNFNCTVDKCIENANVVKLFDHFSETFALFDSITVYNDKGQPIIGKQQFMSRKRPFYKTEWFEEVLQSEELTYGATYVTKEKRQSKIPVAQSFVYQGKKYIVSGLISLENLTNDFLSQENSPIQYAYIVDKYGVVLNSTSDEYLGKRILQGQMSYIREQGHGANYYNVSEEKKDLFYGFYHIKDTDLYCVVYLNPVHFDAWKNDIAWKSTVIRVLAVLFVAICTLALFFPAVEVLKKLSCFTRKISEQNYDDLKIDKCILKRNDELGMLARDLQSMVDKMQNSIKKAQDATMLKNQFIEKMSYEIRTPINNILGVIYLAEQQSTDPLQRNYLSQVKVTANNLIKIIDNILDFSKAEIAHSDTQSQLFNLLDLLKTVKSLVRGKALDKRLNFNFSVNENVPEYIRGNKDYFQGILLNIINNAIKYTKKGYVHVDINYVQENEKSFITFEVVDSGCGIEPEKMETIFENVSKDKSIFQTKAYGLYLVKKYLDKIGGKITVQSEVGKGTSFKVSIPMEIAFLEPQKTALSATSENLFLSVLVLEGDGQQLEIIRKLLEQANCKVFVAVNNRDAVKIAQENLLDLAIIDVDMEIIKGEQAIIDILSVPEQRSLPIIAAGKNLSIERKTLLYEDGAVDYLNKPVINEEFYKLLMKWAEYIKGRG